ncbi:MAG: peptidoglycan recognition family protein [Propioniciclava sp.]|uniref:peptidoglycan recognition protein family protein n=1 Tax=Propioniciclava sp. TaxID=2038686 RepID=UPI0039E4292A
MDVALHWPGAEKTAPTTDAEVSARLRQYQALHQDKRRWTDIAYNHAVDTRGNAYELRGFDRQDGSIKNRGGTVYSVLYLDGTGAEVSDAAKTTIRALFAEAEQRAGRPLKRIGHRDRQSTECPGDGAYRWIQDGSPSPTPNPVQEEIMATKEDLREIVRDEVDAALNRLLDRPDIHVSGDDPDRSWVTTMRQALGITAEAGVIKLPDGSELRADDALAEILGFVRSAKSTPARSVA